ncbi:Plasmodium exported protein (Pm-fam-a like), unknown function [Plasmodium malariae]|uniref:Fam-l protein n=1 Tax=Plasmodium malariae TaxID=5858 RepID=A0A1A8WT85_PLAMA|nr:Plasmodium exported protein (Pm-fam-a like), unknown function [Plasmodium malariae]
MLLPWICYFYSDMSSLNKNVDEKYNLRRKLNPRDYRVLAKYNQDINSSIANSKGEIPNNKVKKRIYISNNKKGAKGKHEHLCRSALYNEEYDKSVDKNKFCVPKIKKYFDFEKKIFKELDYEDYLRNIKTIEYKEYKKLLCKKRRIQIALILLVILVLILPILDLSLEKFIDGGLLGSLDLLSPVESKGGGVASGVQGSLITLLSQSNWGMLEKISASTIFFYCIPFLIFVVIFILVMIYYYKKVINYENIKFKKRLSKK